jgi:hypothetical protein
MPEMTTKSEKKQIKKKDFLGFFMVISPLISSILLWYWFYFIEVLNEMTKYFFIVLAGTILFTTILATIDSHRLGLKVKIWGRKEIYGGSLLKFFIFLLLWIYAYPVYLFRRRNYGGRNLLYPFVFSLLVFIISSGYLYYALGIRSVEEDAFQRRVLHQKRTR